MKDWKYDYTISKEADIDVFINQCNVFERIAGLTDNFIDVDGSIVRIYKYSTGEINVYLDYFVGATYVKSNIPVENYLLKPYIKHSS